MAKDIFISYSRRDQEFVTRLASDLNEKVSGVWFDQSAIQTGQEWHDEIMEGIRDCKAFILVLSPDAVASKYVREELDKALELGKPIFPVIYRPATWTGEFATLVNKVQTLDLRSGSYADNFQKLVDGLLEAEAAITAPQRPFLRAPTQVGMGTVLSKVPGWAFVWGFGWLVFWLIVAAMLMVIQILQRQMDATEARRFVMLFLSGGIGGFIGGILAGLLTMLALRPYAPSISWKHMAPTIRIWAFTGPVGMLVSGVITAIMVAVGAISVQANDTNCAGLSFSQCLGQGLGNAIGQVIAMALAIVGVFALLVLAIWFFTGVFAGRQVVQHIRRLEPGITNGQGRGVALSWGCGSIVAAVAMIAVLGVLLSRMGL